MPTRPSGNKYVLMISYIFSRYVHADRHSNPSIALPHEPAMQANEIPLANSSISSSIRNSVSEDSVHSLHSNLDSLQQRFHHVTKIFCYTDQWRREGGGTPERPPPEIGKIVVEI